MLLSLSHNCHIAGYARAAKFNCMPENVVTAGSSQVKSSLPTTRPGAVPGSAEPIQAARERAPTDLRVLVNHQLSLSGDTSLEGAQKFFGSHDLEFIAVVDNGRTVGLCARRRIGIVLGSRYGFSLFSRNPVRDYLVPEALIIRSGDSIHNVLKRLASRPDEFFYDDVLLEDKDGTFIGSIFVRNLVRLQHNLLLDNIQELERNRAEIERKNIQMEQELVMAGKVQQAMLPQIYPVSPARPGVDSGVLAFYHRYLPAGKVSGDFFHVRRISENLVGVFICDVMGHGVRSAMITSMLRALVEELQSEADEPGELLERLNDDLFAMLHQSDETMYASGIYMIIDTPGLKLCWASAGHPAPILLRADGVTELMCVPREKNGKVLGLVASASYQTCETALAPGDRLLLYTDGIYEIFAGEKEYGLAGFTATIRQHFALPTPQLLDRILESALAFSGAKQFEDDVCLLAIETARA
jgi:sigma-B regulation protein RsbU (phosphoserine phosphatase)